MGFTTFDIPLPITLANTVKGPPLLVPSSDIALFDRLMNHSQVALLDPVERAMATVPTVLEMPASLTRTFVKGVTGLM